MATLSLIATTETIENETTAVIIVRLNGKPMMVVLGDKASDSFCTYDVSGNDNDKDTN